MDAENARSRLAVSMRKSMENTVITAIVAGAFTIVTAIALLAVPVANGL